MLNRGSTEQEKARGSRSLHNHRPESKRFHLLARGLGRLRLFRKCTKIFLLDLVQTQSHPGTVGKEINKKVNKYIGWRFN